MRSVSHFAELRYYRYALERFLKPFGEKRDLFSRVFAAHALSRESKDGDEKLIAELNIIEVEVKSPSVGRKEEDWV